MQHWHCNLLNLKSITLDLWICNFFFPVQTFYYYYKSYFIRSYTSYVLYHKGRKYDLQLTHLQL